MAALEAIGGGPEKFFTGKAQNQWQAWLLREEVKASGLSACAGVGGWILYRGPWPGPKQRESAKLEESGPAQAFTAAQRGWVLWQLRALRQSGAWQLAGLDYTLKGDLAEAEAPSQDPAMDSGLAGPPPLSDKLDREVALPDAKAMDRLPPLPGSGKSGPADGLDTGLTPWDLEGVDCITVWPGR